MSSKDNVVLSENKEEAKCDEQNVLVEKVQEEKSNKLSIEDRLKLIREPGWAPIKEEFLDWDHKKKIYEEYLPKETVEHLKKFADDKNNGKSEPTNSSDEPPRKKQKLKGRNKQRPRDKKVKASDKLCPSIIEERECFFKDNCKFSHEREAYLSSKPPDLGESCYNFETYGKCPFGITCRYGSKHISDEYNNIINEELVKKLVGSTTVLNVIPKDKQKLLWKRKYDFSKSNKILKEVAEKYNEKKLNLNRTVNTASCDDTKLLNSELSSVQKSEASAISCDTSDTLKPDTISGRKEIKESNNDGINTKDNSASTPVICEVNENISTLRHSPSGAVTDEDEIRLRAQEKKKIDFSDKLYLAPLTTVGNLPFRRIVKEFGADITCSEMAVALNLLQGNQSEWALLKKHPSEDLFGAQLCGSFPDSMTRCSQLLSETTDVDFIDINLGCPIDFIFKRGEGSAMMGRHGKLSQVVHGMTSVTDLPITVKIRTGIFEDKYIAHTLVPKLRDWGIAMTTIHGRSREQRYTKSADWEYINKVAEAGKPMPIYGNGDILSFEDANLHREQTGVSGLMIARGALIKPWIFTEIKEQRHWDISSSERFDMLKKFARNGLEHWGSDTEGVGKTRRFLLEWISFLHRYIPVGVLERLPQRINEKPPHYIGRDDMETLLASGNCGDWVKISEMLLGPVPEGFTFLPKHKAASYN